MSWTRAAGSGSVRVREARDLAEAHRAGEIVRAYYVARGLGTGAYLEHLRDAGPRVTLAHVLVAVDADDTVLGSVTYCPGGTPFATISRPGEGELRMLGWVADHRPEDLKLLLIRAGIERARHDGCSAVLTATVRSSGRPDPALRRFGFAADPTRNWSPAPGLHLLAWRLDLGPEGAATDRRRSFLTQFLTKTGRQPHGRP